jgi:Spy/CpxP family protein refolding chaperone
MIKKYKVWVALTLVVIFGLGVAAGVFGERYVMHRWDHRQAQPRTPFLLLAPVAKALGLTSDQQDKLREIFTRNDERMKMLDTEIRGRLRETWVQLKSEIDGVLTPDQRTKLEDLIQKERAKRQGHRPGGEPQRSERGRSSEPEKE